MAVRILVQEVVKSLRSRYGKGETKSVIKPTVTESLYGKFIILHTMRVFKMDKFAEKFL